MDFAVAFKFLKDLSRNNNREWFDKNKPRYQAIKADFDDYVANMLTSMIDFDPSLSGLDPKKLTFRIYRDVRFSKDKSPYKKNFSAAFSAVGKSMGKPGYYFHIQPGHESFVAVGLFQPVPELLAQIRQEVDYNGDRLEKIFKDKKFKTYFDKFWNDDALKTMPKGYPKDHPHADWLKLKSFIVTHNFKDDEVTDAKFMKRVLDAMKSAKPLNDFLTDAIA